MVVLKNRCEEEYKMKDREIRVFIVEADRFLQETSGQWFSRPGEIIFESFSAEDALEACSVERPDVIILDLDMPDSGGIEFLKNVFKGKQVPDIPVICISERIDLATKLVAYISGAKRYMEKPLERSDLDSFISSIIQVRKTAESRLIAIG